MEKTIKGRRVTDFEPKIRLARLRKVKRKTAEEVATATIKSLRPLDNLVKSVTNDHEIEFTHHRKASKDLDAKIIYPIPMRETNGAILPKILRKPGPYIWLCAAAGLQPYQRPGWRR